MRVTGDAGMHTCSAHSTRVTVLPVPGAQKGHRAGDPLHQVALRPRQCAALC